MTELTESQRLDFLRRTWPGAVACETATGVPALISEAQACLESGWGAKADASWKTAGGAVVLQDTTEVVWGQANPIQGRAAPGDLQLPRLCHARVSIP